MASRQHGQPDVGPYLPGTALGVPHERLLSLPIGLLGLLGGLPNYGHRVGVDVVGGLAVVHEVVALGHDSNSNAGALSR